MEIILAEPRGFCAGVRRAIEIVEKAILKYGTPIYVKHEIVHNKFVIESLKSKGVIFTDDLTEIPNGSILIYSAHGVSNAIEEQALHLKMISIDATCPLVKKVHKEVIAYEEKDFEIFLIGHKNHPELEGTQGKLKNPSIATIIETAEDAKTVMPKSPEKIAIATQTTLSLDDTSEIIEILTSRFPALKENTKNDICYATQNRQDAVKTLIESGIDGLIVVGAANSSNSSRLNGIGLRKNIVSFLVNDASEINFEAIKNLKKIGITAGASAPEILVEGVINFFKSKTSDLTITLMSGVKEDTVFFLPKELR
jgi:4-hydroxy-3-methylbut-2-enyl diphosphate reductase